MDKQHFDQLVKGVREMKRHVADKVVRGAKSTEISTPSVCSIRESGSFYCAHIVQITRRKTR